MTTDARRLAAAVTDAYAAQAKPPLTQELLAKVRETLERAVESGAGADSLERLNAALDAFETDLDAVVGPRVASLDEALGTVAMRSRSEAGQPLRAFGGQ
ncbi:MAG: hypothetical protein WAP03_01175 [Methylorubrum rhodinum]|uniref:hypothetical protein n=1 Tax=Methylorubrum rhodinum TaxID=29428 RepID=UPI003BB01C20